MDAIREIARREHRTMSDIVGELLSDGLARRARETSPAFELPTFSMGVPRVNLADRDALESLMDGED